MPFNCKVLQELPDLFTRHRGRVAYSMKTNEEANPIAIRLLSTKAIAFYPQGSPDPIH